MDIDVEEPAAPAQDDRAVVGSRSVDIVVDPAAARSRLPSRLGQLAPRRRLGERRAAGRLLPVLSLDPARRGEPVRLGSALVARAAADEPFVTRDQFRRVLQVLVPTLLFVILVQVLGLYVASFLLVAGFMRSSGGSPCGSRC